MTGQAQRHTLRLDEQGREVDEFGNVVRRATQAVSTLKVRKIALTLLQCM